MDASKDNVPAAAAIIQTAARLGGAWGAYMALDMLDRPDAPDTVACLAGDGCPEAMGQLRACVRDMERLLGAGAGVRHLRRLAAWAGAREGELASAVEDETGMVA